MNPFRERQAYISDRREFEQKVAKQAKDKSLSFPDNGSVSLFLSRRTSVAVRVAAAYRAFARRSSSYKPLFPLLPSVQIYSTPSVKAEYRPRSAISVTELTLSGPSQSNVL